MTEKERRAGSWLRYAALGSSLSAALAGCAVGGYFLGAFLDRRFATPPLFTVILVLAGTALGLTYIALTLMKALGPGAGGRGKDES
ncbi:MAG: AtpZ/AtpI family protein [Gracilibacteraceae bacterium]|nr:AtpZ/AtpI family protein [Gracilibacteraceae bacterium]